MSINTTTAIIFLGRTLYVAGPAVSALPHNSLVCVDYYSDFTDEKAKS